MVGLTNPKTLWAQGSVGEQPVVVLIDLGATHNFISKKLVDVLKIPILATMGPLGYSWGMGTIFPQKEYVGGSSSSARCGNY